MDYEMLKLCTKFLDHAFSLPAIEKLVEKYVTKDEDKIHVQIYARMYYAQSVAVHYNQGYDAKDLYTGFLVKMRNTTLEHRLALYSQGKYTVEQIRRYNRDAFADWFSLELQTNEEINESSYAAPGGGNAQTSNEIEEVCAEFAQVQMGQGITDFITYVPSVIARFAHKTCAGTFTFIMSCFKEAFEKCFGSAFSKLSVMLGWVKDLFDVIEKWIERANESALGLFVDVSEMVSWGMGLTTLTCLVAILERFLLAAGILTNPIGAPTLFLTGAIGIACGAHIFKEFSAGMAFSLTGFVSTCCTTLMEELGCKVTDDIEKEKYQQRQEGQFSIGSVLEKVANSVSTWGDASVVEVGKTFGAITQIKNGIVSMKDMVLFVFGKIGDLVHKYLGFDSMVLADLSVILGQNLVVWLEECDAMVSYMVDFKTGSRDALDRLAQLITKGTEMRNGVVASSHRGSMQVLSLINKALDKLKELRTAAIMTGSNRTRKCPFFVFVTGEAGKGKTSLAQKLTTTWLRTEGLERSEWYSRNGQDCFWSGYHRQAAVSYDDFGAVSGKNSGGISNECEIIGVVSRNPLALTMASIEEKGMHFDSSFIVASSNFKAANADSGVHDAEAYERRRHIMIQVELKEGVPYNYDDFTANQRYVLLNSRSPFNRLRTFDNFSELWSFVYTKYTDHMEEEKRFLQSLDVEETSKKDVVASLFGLCTLFNAQAPAKVLSMVQERYPKYLFLFYWRNNFYLLGPDEELKIVKNDLSLNEREIEYMEAESLKVVVRLQDLSKAHPLVNPLAVHYITSFIKYQWVGENLEPSKTCDDDFIRKQIKRLPRWQRAYLHVMGETFKGEQKHGWFVTQLGILKKEMRYLYLKEFKEWPMVLKLAVGTFMALLLGGSAYCLIQSLWNMGTGPAFMAGAAMMVRTGDSTDGHKQMGDYTFRNVRVQPRRWEGQSMCYGDSQQWLTEQCSAVLSVAGVSMQVCILPGRTIAGVAHALRIIPEGAMVQIEIGASRKYWICWEVKKLKFHENNEIATYTTNMLPLAPESLKERIVYDVETLPDKFNAMFFSLVYNAETKIMEPKLGYVVANVCKQKLTVVKGEYSRIVSKFLDYKANTVKGDCGSLVMAEIKGKFCLVGLHVAGTGTHGSACFIPFVEHVNVQEGQDDFELRYEAWAEPTLYGSGCAAVGVLKPDSRVRTTTKSSLKQTPTEWHLDTPCDKMPAILGKNDERLSGTVHADFDVFKKGMSKYAQEAGPFESDILCTVAAEIVEEWQDAQEDFTFEEVSTEVALNGLENVEYFDSIALQTSEGYPYVLDRQPGEKGKYRYISGDAGSMEICDERITKDMHSIEETSKKEVPQLVCIECPKDERLPIRKVLIDPKTRLFSVLPMSYNLVVRKKFLNFVRFIMLKRKIFPCQVGVNPYSREWGSIADRLLAKGSRILCCDYSRFDGFLPKVVMRKISDMINTLCGGSEELCTSRENLLMACCSRYAICDKLVYKVENGIPSGFPLTVIINSLLNEILIRYAYHKCFEDNPLIGNSFGKFVTLVTYGDDNLISVSEAISSKFNGEFLKTFMASVGITITDGVDKTLPTLTFRSVSECDFLKRSFVQEKDGTWKGPMNKESLWAQLHYVKCNNLEMVEAYTNNLNSVLRELFLHSKQETMALRNKALRELNWLRREDLLTLAQIEAFYQEQKGATRDFITSVNKLENLEFMAPLAAGELPVKTVKMLPNVYLACEHQNKEDLSKYFVISIGTNRKLSEAEGMVITYQYGKGRGGLPTSEFIRSNLLRTNSAINLKLKRAFDGEKPLLFISKDSTVVAMVIATMFLFSRKLITKVESNVCLSKAMNICKSLSFLTKEQEEMFI
uniref:RNA1 polyprotein n=1 Tax=Many-flowered stoneseed fabavirus TaxID=3115797 RepID=A0AAT9J7T5_9SECO